MVVSVILAVGCLALFIAIPNPTKTQVQAMRMGISIGLAGIATNTLGGTIKVKGTWSKFGLTATGAIAIWVLLYLVNPP